MQRSFDRSFAKELSCPSISVGWSCVVQVLWEGSQGCDTPRRKAAHGDRQPKVSWLPAQPSICPEPPQRPAGIAAKAGGGEGGKGDFIELEYICLADISWILLRLLRAAL